MAKQKKRWKWCDFIFRALKVKYCKILIISPRAYICSKGLFVIFSWHFVWNFIFWGGGYQNFTVIWATFTPTWSTTCCITSWCLPLLLFVFPLQMCTWSTFHATKFIIESSVCAPQSFHLVGQSDASNELWLLILAFTLSCEMFYLWILFFLLCKLFLHVLVRTSLDKNCLPQPVHQYANSPYIIHKK